MAITDVTFFNKDGITCPICGAEFKKEELRQGGGRLIAGALTNELRRLYEPSKKFGDVYPLVYQVHVCPKCFYAAYPADFESLKDREKESIRLESKERIDETVALIGKFHFENKRSLLEGLASYILALFCYERREKDSTPTFKKAVSCLRAAWTCVDLHKKFPNDNWDYLSLVFYRKAQFFYNEVVLNEQSGKEAMTRVTHAGPDTDKNYGYEGVLYLAGILEYSYGPKDNPKARVQTLGNAKRALSKIVGMGKASKDKPGILLEKARDLFDEIGNQLKALNAE